MAKERRNRSRGSAMRSISDTGFGVWSGASDDGRCKSGGMPRPQPSAPLRRPVTHRIHIAETSVRRWRGTRFRRSGRRTSHALMTPWSLGMPNAAESIRRSGILS